MKKSSFLLTLFMLVFGIVTCGTDNGLQDSESTTTTNLQSYKITFHCDGLTIKDGVTFPTSYTVDDEVILPTGDDFDLESGYIVKWYDNADLSGDAITKIAKGSTGNKEFWADKKTISYKITFHCDGLIIKDGVTFPTSYTVDDEVTFPTDDDFLESGCIVKWYDNADLSGVAITKIAKGSTGNKEFWADKKTVYKITFHCDGLTIKDGVTFPTSYTVDDEVTFPTDDDFDLGAGYIVKWYDNADLSGDAVTKIAKGSTGNKEFWADKKAAYSITFHCDGLTIKDGVTFPTSYTVDDEVILPTDDDFDIEFGYIIEWHDNADLFGDAITKIAKGSTGNKEFWAQRINGGLLPPPPTTTTVYNNTI